MRIFNGVLSAIFIIFAVLQYNDPDPFQWIVIYGYVAVICAFAMIDKYNRWSILAGIGICLAGAVYYFPGIMEWLSDHELGDIATKMKADQPFIEEARESLGLMIASAALLFQYFRMRKVKG